MRGILKQTITINRASDSQNSTGGIVRADNAVYTNLAASIQPASSSVLNFYAERQIKISQTIYVAGVLALQRGDQITDGTNIYIVNGWRNLAGRDKVMAIDCDDFIP